MQPGKTPPEGGQWVEDWESTTGLCHTADARGSHYRDAVQPDGEPVTSYEHHAEAPGALCFARCPDAPDLDEHKEKWVATVTTGWSISANMGLTVELTKAAKATAGVAGSYSKAVSTAVHVNVPYSHSDGAEDTYREWSCSILRKTTKYRLKVRRFYKGRHGHLVEVIDLDTGQDRLRIEHRGSIAITHATYVAGRPRAVDRPCSSWEDPLPSSGGVELGASRIWDPSSGVDHPRSWSEYRAADAVAMAGVLVGGTEFTDQGRELLKALADGDRNAFDQLSLELVRRKQGDLNDVVPGTARWVAMMVEHVEGLPPAHRTAIAEQLPEWVT